MNMNQTFFPKAEDMKAKWRVIDAAGMVLGRLSTEIAMAIRGKDRASYTPHADTGSYVVVINADKIVLTGNKWDDKVYRTHSGWVGGLKEVTAIDMWKKFPERIIMHAVRGMLPKRTLGHQLRGKLKVYKGAEHPHQAQV